MKTMMTTIRTITIIGTAVLLCAGCGQDKTKFSMRNPLKKEKPVVTKPARMENVDLAKVILKPKTQDVTFTRDPFKPLFEKSSPGRNVVSLSESATSGISGFIYIGRATLNNEPVALLKSNTERSLLRVNDKIKDFIITEIAEEEIILSNGDETITLKRGVLN